MKKIIALISIALLSACAPVKPIPDGYTGPLAAVTDSGVREGSTKAQIFALEAIDGARIDNSFTASARASYGQGMRLQAQFVERQVPARPMKATLHGGHTTGAPIHAIVSQMKGTFLSVEGVVDFSPKPNRKYVVTGRLSAAESSVWIEDIESGEVMTEKVISKAK